jgi:hypothetical protein
VYYDRITEVNDDIADLVEDLKTFNGNRFLISILRKGIRKTVKQYQTFLLEVTAEANAYFKSHLHKGQNKQLHDWTLIRSTETKELLTRMMETTDPALYETSLLLKTMK